MCYVNYPTGVGTGTWGSPYVTIPQHYQTSGAITITNKGGWSINLYEKYPTNTFKMLYEKEEYTLMYTTRVDQPYYSCCWNKGAIEITYLMDSWNLVEYRYRNIPSV